ncbi:MAG TPA: ABC transporter permease [Casimicrobiaceae bacterium]|nr:ABC transporter permease [Casimicrobiaceae bacterium]
MNASSTAVSPEASSGTPSRRSRVRPLYWSVRRELWENRSIYIAPLAVAGVVLIGFMVSAIGLSERRRAVLQLDIAQQRAAIGVPYDIAAVILMLTTVIVGVFYCLDALHGERRDRSILFWKSLPVSDLTTVAAKALVPMAVLPLLAFVVILTTQIGMLVVTDVTLLVHGMGITTSAQLPLLEQSPVLIYGLVTLALWHAPVYGWLLMVSAWAQRATFLWAVLPPLVIAVAERLAFSTSYVGSILKSRLGGSFVHAFDLAPQSAAAPPAIPGAHAAPRFMAEIANAVPDPAKFLSTPGLWIGLVVAALFIAAAVWLRRYRDPM